MRELTANRRIFWNVVAAYSRSLFALVCGLFTSRWVLQALGATDYGLMAVVGSLILFVTFLNTISEEACTRFFALSIGKGDEDETNWWFNTALSIHIVLPTILVLVGWPLGEWAIGRFLEIPPDRVATARWVFRFSLVAAYIAMSSTPFIAMYTAKQNIYELSLWGFLSTILNLVFVWWLTGYKGDAWFVYAAATVSISVSIGLCQVVRAYREFKECRINIRRCWDFDRLKSVFSFSGWTVFGGLGWMAHSSGIAVVLNKFFPPGTAGEANASYSVGSSLAGHTQTLSNALMTAFLPVIVSAEGSGVRSAVIAHVLRAARMSFALCAVFALPLMIEADLVLEVWLKNPPENSALFCRTILMVFIICRLGSGVDAAINATGKIKWYQILNSVFYLSSVPLSVAAVSLGGGMKGVCTVLVVVNVFNLSGMLFFAHRLIDLPLGRWVREVCVPAAAVSSGALFLGWLAFKLAGAFLPAGVRFFTDVPICVACTVAFSWRLLLNANERSELVSKVLNMFGNKVS